jgi:hypothetical protein
MNYEDSYENMFHEQKAANHKTKKALEAAILECEETKKVAEYQYERACEYSRRAEKAEDALRKIEQVQYEGYGAGDSWKVIREIIDAALKGTIPF